MRRGDVVVLDGNSSIDPRLRASIAAPVYENNRVVGGLVVASYDPERRFGPKDEQTDPRDAVKLGDRLVRSLSEPILIDGRWASVGASVGIAMSAAGDDPAELMRRADISMYQAKRNGRNRCEVFAGELELNLAG